MSNIIRAKAIVYGSSCSGKSALIHTFTSSGNQFLKNYNMTQGVEIFSKLIKIPDTNTTVELFMFDCPGKPFYKNLVQKMCSQPSLILLVYDVTSEESFKLVPQFYEQILNENAKKALKGVLFANKTELVNRRLITPKAGRDLANKLGLVYFEGSAKEKKGTEEPFFYLVNEWHKTYADASQGFKMI